MVKYGYINLTGKRIYMATRKKGDESMIKKFLSILLAVCMLACFVPMDAYAIVGSVRSETEEVTNNKGMLMYGREAQSKTRIASPATIPKQGNHKAFSPLFRRIILWYNLKYRAVRKTLV